MDQVVLVFDDLKVYGVVGATGYAVEHLQLLDVNVHLHSSVNARLEVVDDGMEIRVVRLVVEAVCLGTKHHVILTWKTSVLVEEGAIVGTTVNSCHVYFSMMRDVSSPSFLADAPDISFQAP